MPGVRFSGIALLILLGALAVFHILMLSEALPDDIVWGGRTSGSEHSLVMLEVGVCSRHCSLPPWS